jgi:iron-sulfur cluster repair protein YtfE (RIC family)
MNALELLKEDHEKVSELFAQIEAIDSGKEKENLFEKIKTELDTHAHIEETAFYPVLEDYEELKDIVLEAYEEHKQVKTLLREISSLTGDSEKFEAKLSELKENVEHHVEEEETEMFPQIEQLIEEPELERLGEELEMAKKDFSKTSRARSAQR